MSVRKGRRGGATETDRVKSIGVTNGASFDALILPVGDYTAVFSTAGKASIELQFTIAKGLETNLGAISF